MANKIERKKVVIADEQQIFRQGIRSALQSEKDLEISAEFSSGDELLNSLSTSLADVVLLDIKLPPNGGLDLTKTIKKQYPSIAVVLFTASTTEDELFEAIRSRASAYLQRNVGKEDLVKTLLAASAGNHPINDTLLTKPKVAERVLQQFQDLSWSDGVEYFVSPLTGRETQILNFMAQGYLNKQIASELDITEQTIKNHVTSILRKLDANARTQAVIIAVKRGLIKLD